VTSAAVRKAATGETLVTTGIPAVRIIATGGPTAAIEAI
jgi:hypothetical protein